MSGTTRRTFLKGAVAAPAAFTQVSPNDKVNVAVVGFHSRGMEHIKAYAAMKDVRIVALCDVDERLFGPAVAEVEKRAGYRPDTEWDFRKLLERKDLHAVSIATPDYWHCLQTIWACQAGKDVYVEKPISFGVTEGRKMVQASRKYNRIVQAGTNLRSEPAMRAAMRFLNDGKLGNVYRASVDFSKPRASIGRQKEASVPQGVHWDLYVGPTPMRPFTLNHFHYGWHYFWDTAPSEVGNIGVHSLDVCRWGMGKKTHPVKIHCTGGYFLWDSEQQTPNLELGTIEYADGSLIDWEVNNLPAPAQNRGTTFYTSEGYMQNRGGWTPVKEKITPRNRPHPAGVDETVMNASFPDPPVYTTLPTPDPKAEDQENHFENFIKAVRSRKREDQHCEILEGHLSTSLAQLSTISYRVGRKIVFDPDTETIKGDPEASKLLTPKYRAPYVVPDKV